MAIEISSIQWDRGNWPKCGKHGVSREEIEALFRSNEVTVYEALARSAEEERQFAIGPTTSERRRLFVVFTLREVLGETLIRPLSARYMHKKEVEQYEQQKDT